jgi:hypothetical protein
MSYDSWKAREPPDTGEPPSITCDVCGWTSYHPRDIAEHYCGHCHRFLDDEPLLPPQPTATQLQREVYLRDSGPPDDHDGGE